MLITLKYVVFALVATIANLASQYMFCIVYKGSFSLYLAMGIGTLVGLIVKYILDKKFIFSYFSKNASEECKTFIQYTGMAIFTTLIFWGFELGFFYSFENKKLRYLGAILGLAIGYTLKYQLDRIFVFKNRDI